MKIGILQTGHAPEELTPELGDYSDMFRRLLSDQGFDFVTFSVVDGDFPESAESCDGWLVTGSKPGAYEDHPGIPPLEELIRQIITLARPLVGVCFGHQIIAQALGGKVEKFDGGWSIGHTIYDFGGVPMAFNAWHQDQVTELPEGATILASSDFCQYAALAYGNRALTIQPHPEFDGAMVEGLINYRGRGAVPDPLIEAAEARLALPTASGSFADQMADFFRMER